MEQELRHHGIEGQKWGQRNGPPYPLDPKDYSKAEKQANKIGRAIQDGSYRYSQQSAKKRRKDISRVDKLSYRTKIYDQDLSKSERLGKAHVLEALSGHALRDVAGGAIAGTAIGAGAGVRAGTVAGIKATERRNWEIDKALDRWEKAGDALTAAKIDRNIASDLHFTENVKKYDDLIWSKGGLYDQKQAALDNWDQLRKTRGAYVRAEEKAHRRAATVVGAAAGTVAGGVKATVSAVTLKHRRDYVRNMDSDTRKKLYSALSNVDSRAAYQVINVMYKADRKASSMETSEQRKAYLDTVLKQLND